MYCKKCGAELLDNSKFCGNCGTELTKRRQEKITEDETELETNLQKKPAKVKKEKRYLRMPFMIMILLCMILTGVGFFVPIINFDTKTTREVVQEAVSEIKGEIDKTDVHNKDKINSCIQEEVSRWEKENYIEKMQMGIQYTANVSDSKISLWDLIVLPEGAVRRAIQYYEQENGVDDEIHGSWEAEMGDALFEVKIVLIVIGIIMVFILISIVLVTIFKRTKFICLICSSVYSAIIAVGVVIFIWGLPQIVWDVLPQSDLGYGVEYTSVVNKFVGRIIYISWDHIVASGVYILLLGSVLLFLVSLISLVSFNKIGKKKKNKAKSPALAMFFVCSVAVFSLTGCGVKDTNLNDQERVQLGKLIDQEFGKMMQGEYEQYDYELLLSVEKVFAEVIKGQNMKYMYRRTTDNLPYSIKTSMEEKLGKTLEEVQKEFKSEACKGQIIHFSMIADENNERMVQVYLNQETGIWDSSISYRIEEPLL